MLIKAPVFSRVQRVMAWVFLLLVSAGMSSCNTTPRQTVNNNDMYGKQARHTYQTNTHVKRHSNYASYVPEPYDKGSAEYQAWLAQYPYRKQRVAEYQRYLASQAGYVPPMEQMLRSARSWQKCGFEPYEVPPENYWAEMVPTLKLVKLFKDQGVFTAPFRIVSVYRNPELNRCAKGSQGSKHLMNAAVDIRVDYTDEFQRSQTEFDLCEFWNTQGDRYNFGLGLYKSGTIHIDTQGYRRWGSSHGSSSSPCHS